MTYGRLEKGIAPGILPVRLHGAVQFGCAALVARIAVGEDAVARKERAVIAGEQGIHGGIGGESGIVAGSRGSRALEQRTDEGAAGSQNQREKQCDRAAEPHQ